MWRRLPVALALVFFALLCLALPAKAEDDYETTLDRLSRLQALALNYIAEQDSTADPIVLTLAYTRTGDYNTATWQLTAGTRDAGFESYVNTNDPDLAALQGMNGVFLPNGQGIDFGHLMASMNLVYNGMPITGSWGGDCMQLAQVYQGQASDAEGYMALMQETFAMEDDGTNSYFGTYDVRADMDSVVVGSALTKDTNIADALRSYYDGLTDYDRAYQFIALSCGDVNTGDTATFRQTVYNTMVGDTGMQLLLYMSGMWSKSGWQINESDAPALQGAAYLFADYLSAAVNGEKVKSDSDTRMVTMAAQALADALSTLGDSDAASAALAALGDGADSTAPTADTPLTEATQTIQNRFDVQIFQLVLLILGAAALLVFIVSMALFISHRRNG